MIWRFLVALQVFGVALIAHGFLFPSNRANPCWQSKLYAQNHGNKEESRSIIDTIQQKAGPIFSNAVAIALLSISLQQSVQAVTTNDVINPNPLPAIIEQAPAFDALTWFEEKSASGSKLLTTTVRNADEQFINTKNQIKPLFTTISESLTTIQPPQLTLPSADISLNPNTLASLIRSLPSQWPTIIPIIGAVFFADQVQSNEQLKVTIAEYEGVIDELKQALNESEKRNSFTNSTILQLEQSTLTWQQEITKLEIELAKRASELSDLRSNVKDLELARVTRDDSDPSQLKLQNEQLQNEINTLKSQLLSTGQKSTFSSGTENLQISSLKSPLETENEKLKMRELEIISTLRSFLVQKKVMSQGIANLITPSTVKSMLLKLSQQPHLIFGPNYTQALEQEVKLLQYKFESKNGVLQQELRKKDDILDGVIAKAAMLEEALQKAEKEKAALSMALKKAEEAAAGAAATTSTAAAAAPAPVAAKEEERAARMEMKPVIDAVIIPSAEDAPVPPPPAAVAVAVKKEVKPIIEAVVIPPVEEDTTVPPPAPDAVAEKKKKKKKRTTAAAASSEGATEKDKAEAVANDDTTTSTTASKPKRGPKPGTMKKTTTASTADTGDAQTQEKKEKVTKKSTKKAPASTTTTSTFATSKAGKAQQPKKEEETVTASPPPTTAEDTSSSYSSGKSAQQMKEEAMARAKQKAEAMRADAVKR